MKLWGLFGVSALCVAVAGAQTIQDNNDQGNGIEQSYNYSYSRSHEKTMTGYITGKVKGFPQDGKAASMMITLKTSRGKQYQVDLGPVWYVGEQTAKLNIGDKIKITGEAVSIKSSRNDTEKVFIARLIQKGRQVLALRDRTGEPYWVALRKGKYAIDGTQNSINGTYVGQTDVTVNNEKQVGYQIQTANGLVNVAVAPDWYLEQQGLGFRPGEDVTVYTGVGAARVGPDLIVADGLYGTSFGTVVLRPNGVPVWNNWTNTISNGF